MADVHHRAHIGPVHLLQQQQGFAHGRYEAVRARFFGFVFQHQLDLGHVFRTCDRALDDPIPRGLVVGLEWIVVAILSEPKIHYLAVELPGPFHRFLDFVDRLLPNPWIVGCKRAPAPFRRGPNVRGDARHREPGIGHLPADPGDIVVVDVPHPNQLHAREAGHLRRGRNELVGGEPFAVARKDVTVGARIEGVDIGRETKCFVHGFSLQYQVSSPYGSSIRSATRSRN